MWWTCGGAVAPFADVRRFDTVIRLSARMHEVEDDGEGQVEVENGE